eukprot:gene119-288_t
MWSLSDFTLGQKLDEGQFGPVLMAIAPPGCCNPKSGISASGDAARSSASGSAAGASKSTEV